MNHNLEPILYYILGLFTLLVLVALDEKRKWKKMSFSEKKKRLKELNNAGNYYEHWDDDIDKRPGYL